MGQRCASRHFMQRAVSLPTIVFLPSHLTSVCAKVFPADVVELTDLGAAHPGEEGLGLVRARAIQAVGNRVVDPVHLVVGM